MEFHFVKGKGSRFDLQVAFSVQNKLMGTENNKKKVCEKLTLRKEFCACSEMTKFKMNVIE